MTEVRLNSTIRKAPNVVLKIYRLIEPIPYAVPQQVVRTKLSRPQPKDPFRYLRPAGSMTPPEAHL
jgi:hypothetical protein